MRNVYVIGPVRGRLGPLLNKFEKAYHKIQDDLGSAGFNIILPDAEQWLEQASPKVFYEEIARRITDSDIVISVFPDENVTAHVETTMASFLEKTQYVITDNVENLSRLLRGLPNIARIAKPAELSVVLTEIKQKYLEPPPMRLRLR